MLVVYGEPTSEIGTETTCDTSAVVSVGDNNTCKWIQRNSKRREQSCEILIAQSQFATKQQQLYTFSIKNTVKDLF